MIIPIIDANEFWSWVHKPEEGCWTWTRYRTDDGYGTVVYQGQRYYTHIVAFYLSIGIWPGDRHILHTCDNPPCCRPDHLIGGTNKENINDCISKGRRTCKPPSQTFLTQQDVAEIRRLALFDFSPKEISEMTQFKGRIGRDGVWKIIAKKTWKSD
jgi:hypothetical protein